MADLEKGDVKTFSFDKVTMNVNGGSLSGFWEGDDAVTIEDGADVATPSVGAGGAVVLSISTDQTAIYTVKLQATGGGHAILNKLYRQAKATGGFLFPSAIRDRGTGEGYNANKCYIIGAPTRGFGQNASMREWKIFAGKSVANNVAYNGL